MLFTAQLDWRNAAQFFVFVGALRWGSPLAAAGDLDGARVVGRVADFGDRDDQTPLDRCLSDARYHSIEQVALVLRRGASGRLRFERVDRRCSALPTKSERRILSRLRPPIPEDGG